MLRGTPSEQSVPTLVYEIETHVRTVVAVFNIYNKTTTTTVI